MAEAIIDHGTTEGPETGSGRLAFGGLLTGAGFLTEAQLAEALDDGAATGERLGEVVVRRGWATEDDVAKLLAEQWHLGYVDRASIYFDSDALGRMSREEAQRLEALPTRVQDGRVVVAVAEPTEQRLSALRAVIGEDTVVVVVPKTALDAGLRSELLTRRKEEPSESDADQLPEPHPPAEQANGAPAGSSHAGETELDRILTALETAAADAAALGTSVNELAGRLAELVGHASSAVARLTDAADTREDDQGKVDRLEQQLAQRTELTESLREQLAGLTRTLENL